MPAPYNIFHSIHMFHTHTKKIFSGKRKRKKEGKKAMQTKIKKTPLSSILIYVLKRNEREKTNLNQFWSLSRREDHQEILDELLKNYDLSRIRPPPINSDLNETVHVNILVRMLSKIDVVNMEYTIQITFREQWLDKRLNYQNYSLSQQRPLPSFLIVPHVKAKIWFPDTFFPTEKLAHRHMIDSENMFVRIYQNGSVLYSSRLSLVCSCPMYLHLYPLDVQNCDFDLISYAHTTKDIIYEWAGNKSLHDSVQIKQGVGKDLPDFKLDFIDTGIECTSHTNTGSYACLRMRIRLSRLFTYFVLQLYIPTSMVVSFWIDMHSTAGRVTLAITTLLTITTMQSLINAKLPPVNYIKVVDVWLGACELFVFSLLNINKHLIVITGFALVEYAIVCYQDSTLRNEKRRKSRLEQKSVEENFELLPSQAEEQHWDDWTTGEKSVMYGNDKKTSCSCELGGIGNAVLVSLGMVPISGILPSSLLIPIATTAQEYPEEKQNYSPEVKSNQPFSLKMLNLRKQDHPFWTWLKNKLKKSDYQPARIDYYARIWMPIFFILFSCVYWAVCLFIASKQYV
ncbi:hypothetical protein Mgra_00004552 [Meloidogyne graminicola]|uniref:Glutamate-gated chloride channel n=1 Tax=Meloidogyne graminicola TaxID=189291 RepID=A0A8S9ZSU8_9BILA|nr:hypothetical protein Mgra_00004552 [Meloidogyne graminicola]